MTVVPLMSCVWIYSFLSHLTLSKCTCGVRVWAVLQCLWRQVLWENHTLVLLSLCSCPSVQGWPIKSDLFGWLDAWMQPAVLLEGINVRVSREHPWEQRSNVQFHEDLGPGCMLSLSVSSSLSLLWRAVTTLHSIGSLSVWACARVRACVRAAVCLMEWNIVIYSAVCLRLWNTARLFWSCDYEIETFSNSSPIITEAH